MKRFLLAIIAITMIFGTTHRTFAVPSNNTFYFDYVLTDKTDYNNKSFDWEQSAVTAEVPLEEFKIGLDYSTGNLKHQGTEFEILNYKLKGGFAIVNNEQIRFDVTTGYFNGEYKTPNEFDKTIYKSMIIGFDTKLFLSETVWVDINYAYGINPEVTTEFFQGTLVNTHDMNNLTLSNFRLNFKITDENGLSIGYIKEKLHSSHTNSALNVNNSGYTIGLSYLF